VQRDGAEEGGLVYSTIVKVLKAASVCGSRSGWHVPADSSYHTLRSAFFRALSYTSALELWPQFCLASLAIKATSMSRTSELEASEEFGPKIRDKSRSRFSVEAREAIIDNRFIESITVAPRYDIHFRFM